MYVYGEKSLQYFVFWYYRVLSHHGQSSCPESVTRLHHVVFDATMKVELLTKSNKQQATIVGKSN
jgi:hypothetical protein